MSTKKIAFDQLYYKARKHTLVSKDRCKILYDATEFCTNLEGAWFECGVYKGGTALLLSELIREGSTLHLFDTFDGMPPTDPEKDRHQIGDFNDVSLEQVQQLLSPSDKIIYHKGFMPDTFAGLENEKIALAHIDVDIYNSVLDCCNFIYPRLVAGGAMIFDDFGFDSCPGAKLAVNEFFSDKPEAVQVLETNQAVIIKG